MALNANNGGSDGVLRIEPPPAPRAHTTGPQNSEYSITICHLEDPAQVLATHRRGGRSHEWIIDPTHWDGLPNGAGRAICHTEPDQLDASLRRA